MIRVLSRIKSEPWAITDEAMQTILEIAARENESPQAVAAKIGRPLENTYDAEIRGGVGILTATGPLFRYANLFNQLSGATSYDLLARDFAEMVDNPQVRSIVLNIDSPGGEANGVAEFADMIYAARSAKPIVAYVGGMGASAAYWIASAASEVVIGETAMLGSIGTVLGIQDTSERDAKSGVKRTEIVSSQSPNKRVDAFSEEGRAKLQARVDALSDVFIAKVARNRGVDTDTVLQDFGQGDVFVGQAAVTAGLADRIGSFEGVIAELQGARSGASQFTAAASGTTTEVQMDQQNGAPAADNKPGNTTDQAALDAARSAGHAAGITEGASAERGRVKAILTASEAEGRGDLASHLAFDTDMPADAAVALLGKSPKAAAAGSGFASFNAAMSGTNPPIGADGDTSKGDPNPGDELVNTAKQLGLA